MHRLYKSPPGTKPMKLVNIDDSNKAVVGVHTGKLTHRAHKSIPGKMWAKS